MMMMMIGDPPRPHPTVQIPTYSDDPTAHIHSPISDASIAPLQRYLPSNQDDVVYDPYEDDDDYDIPVDAFSCDNFRMYEFKVKKCARARSHDWTECPFAHPGEKARRRDPRKFHYSGSACPDFRKGACRMGDACELSHGVFECWLHPARYRTQPCKDGTHCRRRVCFFAHTPDQLRFLSPDSSPGRLSHDSFVLIGSPTKTAAYSPPSSPQADSPPMGLGQLTDSFRGMQLGKMKMGSSLSMSPPSWGVNFGSARSPSAARRGFASHPTTPMRAVTRSGLGGFEEWEGVEEEEPAMERVESGKALREKIYAKLVRENSLDRVRRVDSPGTVPDIGWVSELVK